MRIKLSPLASQVRGRHGGTVYTKGRGSATIRRFKSPINTQTAGRTQARNVFANLQFMYSSFKAPLTTSIEEYPRLGAVTPRNFFVGLNMALAWWGDDLRFFITMPVHHPGQALLNYNAGVSGPNHVTFFDYPPTPPGWSYAGVMSWAFRSPDPREKQVNYDWDFSIYWNAEKPEGATVTGQPRYPASIYLRGGQIRWLDPDGVYWYSEPMTTCKVPY